jgi:hypothetical protein
MARWPALYAPSVWMWQRRAMRPNGSRTTPAPSVRPRKKVSGANARPASGRGATAGVSGSPKAAGLGPPALAVILSVPAEEARPYREMVSRS